MALKSHDYGNVALNLDGSIQEVRTIQVEVDLSKISVDPTISEVVLTLLLPNGRPKTVRMPTHLFVDRF